MVNSDLLDILVCPETGLPVALANAELLGRVNAAIAAGTLKTRDGIQLRGELEAGLVREDGQVLYPVREDIPVMLIDESISLVDLS